MLSRLSKKKTAVGEKKHPTSSSNENIDNEHDDNVQEEDLDDGSISAVDSDILEGPSRDFTPYRSASGPEEEGQATTIARAETKAVQWLKLLVLLVLILSATGVGIAVYKYTSRSEQEQFQEAFEGNSRKVLEVQFEAGLRWLVRSFVRSQALRFPHTNGCFADFLLVSLWSRGLGLPWNAHWGVSMHCRIIWWLGRVGPIKLGRLSLYRIFTSKRPKSNCCLTLDTLWSIHSLPTRIDESGKTMSWPIKVGSMKV